MKTKLFQKLSNSVSNSDKALFKKSFEILNKSFQDENKILHSLRVSLILKEMKLDSNTISAAILHDILDDIPALLRKKEIEGLKKILNPEISFLIEKCFEVQKIRLPFSIIDFTKRKELKNENLRKMFLAMAEDLRVLLITLTSRLDHLRNLESISAQEKKLYSFETFELFIPIAERLGVWQLKSEMEDLAFSYLYPEKFKWIKKNIKNRYAERKEHLEEFKSVLKIFLRKEKVKILEIKSRTKTYWSSWQKLLSHGMDFKKIYDLIGIQIILKDVKECYKVLGVLHQNWTPMAARIKDFIAKPKLNGYRALHTTLITKDREMVEIQIKTVEMQKEADFGICAHWAYKEKVDLKKESKLPDWTFSFKEGPKNVFKNFKINFFQNKVFIFSPKGDVIALAKDSTPIDFAYAIHTDVGNHCEEAKINGKISHLTKILKNGEIVEILTNRNKTPSRDWLNFVETSLAKSQIKKWFGRLEEQEFPGERVRKKIELKKVFLKKEKILQKQPGEKKFQIILAGQRGILLNMAKCCNPQPGEKISGYITKNRGATVHQINCKNFIKLSKKFSLKVVKAEWSFLDKEKTLKPISLKILAKDRIGLFKDISTIISFSRLNISKYHGETENQEGLAQISMEVEIKERKDLEKLLREIKKIKGIISVKT